MRSMNYVENFHRIDLVTGDNIGILCGRYYDSAKNRGLLYMGVSLSRHAAYTNAMDSTEDSAMFEQSDSSDDNDEEPADIAEGLTAIDISDESDEKLNGFYNE